MSLADARNKLLVARKLVADGIDPNEQRKKDRVGREARRATTVKDCALEVFVVPRELGPL